jgi:hypothetical protein
MKKISAVTLTLPNDFSGVIDPRKNDFSGVIGTVEIYMTPLKFQIVIRSPQLFFKKRISSKTIS